MKNDKYKTISKQIEKVDFLSTINLSSEEIENNYLKIIDMIDKYNLCMNSKNNNCNISHTKLQRSEDGKLYECHYNCQKQIMNKNPYKDLIIYHDLKKSKYIDIFTDFIKTKYYLGNLNIVDDEQIDKTVLMSSITKINNLVQNNQLNSIYINAPIGTGKTTLLNYLLFLLLSNKQYKIIYIKSSTLFSTIFNSWSYNINDDSKELLNTIKNVKVLAIDDFGLEKINENYFNDLFSILKYRFENKLITIFCSEVSLDSIYLSYQKKYTNKNLVDQFYQLLTNKINFYIKGEFYKKNSKK